MDGSGRQPNRDGNPPPNLSLKPIQPQPTTSDSPNATTSATVPASSYTQSEAMYTMLHETMPGSSLRVGPERHLPPNSAQTTEELPPPLQDMQPEVEKSEGEGYTYLMLAARDGRLDVVRVCLMLAQSGQAVHHPNKRGSDGNNALMLALEHGHTDIACVLVDAGTDLSLVNGKLETALAIACKRGDHHAAEFILANGGGPSCGLPDRSGTTPLIHAASLGDVKLVQTLLTFPTANISAEDENGHTALTLACHSGHVATAKALVEGGALVNQRTRDDSTALIAAAAANNGSPDIIRLLIKAGADVDACTHAGLNSVIGASRQGQAEILRLLIEAEADLNRTCGQGQTALKYAVVRSVVSLSPCLSLLLNAGVHIGPELHYAVSLGFVHVVEQFLKHGAEPIVIPTRHLFQVPYSRGIQRVSPLAVALLFQNLKLAEAFLDSGFLTDMDVRTLANDVPIRTYLIERNKKASQELMQARLMPCPLQMLCLQAASKLVGYDYVKRRNRVQSSGLPPSFQRRLSYECVPKEG